MTVGQWLLSVGSVGRAVDKAFDVVRTAET
jgi:hypothetical protein